MLYYCAALAPQFAPELFCAHLVISVGGREIGSEVGQGVHLSSALIAQARSAVVPRDSDRLGVPLSSSLVQDRLAAILDGAGLTLLALNYITASSLTEANDTAIQHLHDAWTAQFAASIDQYSGLAGPGAA